MAIKFLSEVLANVAEAHKRSFSINEGGKYDVPLLENCREFRADERRAPSELGH